MQLRKYQEDGLVSIRDFFNSSLKTGIYVSPVGTGKSILIAESAKMRKNVLVLQPSSELLKQNYEKYSYYGFPASIYSASLKSRQVGDVTFATIGSVMGEKDRFKGVDTIIVDEVHRGSKKDNLLSELVSYLKVEKVLGFTATPIMAQNTKDESYLRMMDSYRECIFDNIIHITQIQEILPFWTPIEYKFSKTQANSSMLKLNSTGNDYTVESLKRFYDSNSIEFKILKSIEWLKSQGVNQSLIFVPTVEEAQSLANQIKGAELMCGDKKLVPDKERLRIVEGFKSGEIKYVVNVDVLGTGFNVSGTNMNIVARFTRDKSSTFKGIGLGYDTSSQTGIIYADTATTSIPSNIAFWTLGSGVYSEKMRVTGAGNVGIGTSSPSTKLHINTTATAENVLKITNSTLDLTLGVNTDSGGSFLFENSNNALRFGTNATERMRITSGGRLLVGQTSVSSASVNGACIFGDTIMTGSFAGVFWENRSGGVTATSNWYGWYTTGGTIFLYNGSANIASINSSTGIYTPLSDVNKKKDFEASKIGLNAILNLKPTLYRMKSDNTEGDKELGFIAQEVKEFIPQAYVESEDFIGLNYVFT